MVSSRQILTIRRWLRESPSPLSFCSAPSSSLCWCAGKVDAAATSPRAAWAKTATTEALTDSLYQMESSKRRTFEFFLLPSMITVAISLTLCWIDCRRPVKLKDFAEHYRRMAADSDFLFSEEFDCLKHVGRDQPCMAADLPVNRPKNRFTNILPYDHSRFKLLPTDDEEGSDYINSNYVPVTPVYSSKNIPINHSNCLDRLL